MPKSRGPRQKYDADRAVRGREQQLERMAANKPEEAVPLARKMSGGRKALLLGGGAAVGGGVAYGLHRHRRNQGVSKMIDPTTGQPFAKAYKVAMPVPGSTRVKTAIWTGKHVSHGNDLHHVTHNASPRDGRLHMVHKADDTALHHVKGRGQSEGGMHAHARGRRMDQGPRSTITVVRKYQAEGARGRRIA